MHLYKCIYPKCIWNKCIYENAFGINAFIPNAFGGNAFLQNAFAINAFIPNAFRGNAFPQNAFERNAFQKNAFPYMLASARKFSKLSKLSEIFVRHNTDFLSTQSKWWVLGPLQGTCERDQKEEENEGKEMHFKCIFILNAFYMHLKCI